MVALHRPALPFPRTFLKQRQGWIALLAAGAIVVGAMAFQVSQLSTATVTSYEINDLNRQRAALQAENHDLEARVAELSSLARVDIEARLELGMQPAQRKLYVDVNQPLPQTQTLPTRFLPPDANADLPAQDPFWKRLLRVLPFF
jgi:cell division protein FtsL